MLTAILLTIVAVLALWDGVAELRKRGMAASGRRRSPAYGRRGAGEPRER